MSQSLVEHLMVELPSESDGMLDSEYSDLCHYNIVSSGLPAVEIGSGAEVRTITRVKAEEDDFESAAMVRTKTEARPEDDDFETGPLESEMAPSSSPQLTNGSASRLKTKTFVERETDDWSPF